MAGTGATIGGAVGGIAGTYFGPVGTVAGGLAGSWIGGQFDNNTTYQSPNFSDINLATENPELYAQLQQVNAQAAQAEALYNQRRQGLTPEEEQELGSSAIAMQGRLANNGLLGTSAGLSAEGAQQQTVRAQIADRAFKEQQTLAQAAEQAQQQAYQDTMAAENQVMGPKTQGAQINFQNQIAQNQGNNQFVSSLINGGLKLGAAKYNIDQGNAQLNGGYNPSTVDSALNSPLMSSSGGQGYYGSPDNTWGAGSY